MPEDSSLIKNQNVASGTNMAVSGAEKSLSERAKERLRFAGVRLADAEAELIDKSKAAARAGDGYVHDNPWQSVGIAAGIAAGIALLLGMIIGRRH